MTTRLNRSAYDHAKELVLDGHFVLYARWHVGVDDTHREDTKARYGFPYGDFDDVHRCAVLSAESRAAQYGHDDIERAVAHLHGMLDAHVGAQEHRWRRLSKSEVRSRRTW